MISLDAIAGLGAPRLLIAGDTARSPAAALVRTAAIARRSSSPAASRRARARSGSCSTSASRSRSASRGRSSPRGIPALTLTTVPGRPVAGLRGRPGSAPQRLGELGRAAQNLVGSLDAGLELAQGTTSYVYLGARFVRGWAIELVLLTALLPFLIGASTSSRAAGGGGSRLRPAARSLRSRLVFWGYAGLLLFVAAQARRVPGGRAAPAAARRAALVPALAGRRSACSARCCSPAGSSAASA